MVIPNTARWIRTRINGRCFDPCSQYKKQPNLSLEKFGCFCQRYFAVTSVFCIGCFFSGTFRCFDSGGFFRRNFNRHFFVCERQGSDLIVSARQGFLTQYAAKFAEKTCAYAYEDRFLYVKSYHILSEFSIVGIILR